MRTFYRTPPVLGFFHNSQCPPRFIYTHGSPSRIVHAAAVLCRDGYDDMWWFFDCRHGRALLHSSDWADLLVWDPMYWLLDESSILEFHLGNRELALVEVPSETFSVYKRNIRVMRSEGGGLGLTAVKNFGLHRLHLWGLEVTTAKWVLCAGR
jgi:hypothetical protein